MPSQQKGSRTQRSPVHSRHDLNAAVGGFCAQVTLQRWQCAIIGGKGNRQSIEHLSVGSRMVARHVAHSGRLANRVTATQILRSGLMPLLRLTAAPEWRRTAPKGRRGCGSCQYAVVVLRAFRPSPPKRAMAVQQAVAGARCRCASSKPTTAGCRQQPGRSEIEWNECAQGGAVDRHVRCGCDICGGARVDWSYDE
jgi:hypothetical protein